MTVELLKGRGKLRRLLCSLLAALMLLPWVMQGAWAAGGTREVKSREIAVVFDNSGSMYDAGNTAVSGSARTEFSGGGKKKGRLSITSPKYTANPLAKCGMVLELEAVNNRWTRSAERKARVTAVSAVNGSAVGSIKVGTLVFNRDPATGKLVSTKKTATTEIGNNRACNVSGQVLDSTGIPVPMGLGVTLKFSK